MLNGCISRVLISSLSLNAFPTPLDHCAPYTPRFNLHYSTSTYRSYPPTFPHDLRAHERPAGMAMCLASH